MKNFIVLIVSLFLSIHSYQMQAQTQRATLSIDASSLDVKTFTIPLKKSSPFIAFSLSWAGAENSFLVRFSEDKRNWTSWKTLPIDAHGENNFEKRVSELHFANKEMRFFQLSQNGTPVQVQNLIVHLFNPGDTDERAINHENTISLRSPFCPCAQPDYLDRQGWCPAGNCPESSAPTFTNETHLIVHHSAGSNNSSDWAATVRAIWDFHVNTNGWDDVGYNWLIDPNGVIYEGRGDGVLGAHFCGMNTNTMGVCMIGDYTDISPSTAAKDNLAQLLAWKACDDEIDPAGTSFHFASNGDLMNISGHRDGCATQCPGNTFYPEMPDIRDAVVNFIANNCSPLAPPLSLEGEVLSSTETQLDWTDNTDGETGFEIERSRIISSLWMPVTTVTANTTTYNDTGLNENTKYFYRVRAVNETDTSAFSNVVILNTTITAVENTFNTTNVEVFPNPTKDEVFLQIDHPKNGALQLELTDLSGRIIQSRLIEKTNTKQQFQFSLNALPTGLYFLKLSMGASHGVFKVVKL